MSIISKALYGFMLGCGILVENKFNKITENSIKVNEKLLFEIVSKNLDTMFGQEHDFKDISSIKDYKNKVPLSNYLNYEKYIELMEKGQKSILVNEEIEYFGHTSGTTGKQKLIPVTKSGRKVASKYMAILNMKFAYNNFKENWTYGKGLMIADIVTTSYTEGGIPICSATSGGFNAIKKVLPYLYTSPYEVMEIKDKQVALYLHILFALKETGLLYISGVFISNILDLLRVLEKNCDSLVWDIRKGKINTKLNVEDKTRKRLNEILSPDAGRADWLEEEFKKGFKGICRRIWPNLAYIACVTGANFSIYEDKVDYFTGDLPIFSPAYGATEAMIGVNPYASEIKYVVIPDTVFYEFIEIKDIDKKEPYTYSINELRLGEKYEIVVTNRAGLYRYRLGDVIEVVGFYNDSPEIKFLYRKNQCLNMVSEKTTEDHLTVAMINTMKKLNLNLVDYTTIEDNLITPGRYVFYIEFKYKPSSEKIKTIQRELDKELCRVNLAYGRFRENNRLSSLKVIIIKENTFNIIKENQIKRGVSKNQIKIPRVVTQNKNILKVLNENRYRFQ